MTRVQVEFTEYWPFPCPLEDDEVGEEYELPDHLVEPWRKAFRVIEEVARELKKVDP